MDVPGLLHLLKTEPTLLPAAPDSVTGEDIERRRRDEVHYCLVCGEHAMTTVTAEAPDGSWQGKRWLDLCYPHFNEVRAKA